MNLTKSTITLAALLLGVATASTVDRIRPDDNRRPGRPGRPDSPDNRRPGQPGRPGRPDDRRPNRNSDCQQGRRDGQQMVRNIFQNDCNVALSRSFQRDVNRNSNRRFGNNRGGWQNHAYNQCAQDAVEQELQRIGRQCQNSGQAADDCNKLGQEAARAIVYQSDVCPTHEFGAAHSRHDDLRQFQRSCRRVAYGVCEGFISNAADQCGARRMSLRTQEDLQSQCRAQVNRWTSASAVGVNLAAQYNEFDAQAIAASSFITSDADANDSEEEEYDEEDPLDNQDGADDEDGPTKAAKWTRNAVDSVKEYGKNTFNPSNNDTQDDGDEDGAAKAAQKTREIGDKIADGTKDAADNVAEWGKKTFDPNSASASKSFVVAAASAVAAQVFFLV